MITLEEQERVGLLERFSPKKLARNAFLGCVGISGLPLGTYTVFKTIEAFQSGNRLAAAVDATSSVLFIGGGGLIIEDVVSNIASSSSVIDVTEGLE